MYTNLILEPDAQASGDLPLTDAAGKECLYFDCMLGHGRWPPAGASFLARLGDSGLHPITQDVAFELSKYGEHAAGRPPPPGVVMSSVSVNDAITPEDRGYIGEECYVDISEKV